MPEGSLRVFFLRHGQTEFSRENAFCGSGLNPGLTDDGKEMAELFAQAYKVTKWDGIYISPLTRCQVTARPLVSISGVQPEIRDGLKEIDYGQWEGKSVEEVDRLFHDDYIKWSADPAWNPPTDGERAVAVAVRAMGVVEEIQLNHKSGNILVVSHKATIRIVLCALLGIDVGRFRYRIGCPVASVSVVEFLSQGPLVKCLADRSHLNDRLRNLPGT